MNLFDEVIERRDTGSLKWDRMQAIYNRVIPEDTIPLWIADMDFAAPRCIREAIDQKLQHGVFGYSFENDACQQAITNWLATQHDTVIQPEWILYHQGVVPAIGAVVDAFTKKGDHILMTEPIYPPFFHVPEQMDRTAVYCPLKEENGTYTLDFALFEQALRDEKVTLFILCHPHNPIGFTWSESELRTIAALCKKHHVLLLSDEIHSDLVLSGEKHVPLLKAAEQTDHIISLFAPTKTFNIAGIHAAFIFVPDAARRLTLKKYFERHFISSLNVFAIAAIEGAFSEEGARWLEQLKDYLRTNSQLVVDTLQTIPGVRVQKQQATYLMWIDYRDTLLAEADIMNALLDHGVALDAGSKYGAHGKGFLRLNIACPKTTLTEALERIQKAFASFA